MNWVRELLKIWLLINCFLMPLNFEAQIANYVSNGGLEDHYPCVFIPNNLSIAKNWRTIDSLPGNIQYCNTCTVYSNVPYNGFGFQYPRTGNSYAMSTFMCQSCASSSTRGYFRNRLKTNLQPGKTYCVKFYVNISNNSSYGIDKFSAYFGNNTLDTITKCLIPLTYINPQIQNPINNFVTDTLGWTLITGTFIATGVEKHMVIGNFKSDANTNKVLINPANLPSVATDVLIDDVSCIDIDLPAYAGPDIWGIPTNTVYLGRPQDVGIDEACMWYKLPNTTTAIDTAAGITVTVGVTTNTYIVRQEICGNVKWDTVVVYPSALGLAVSSGVENSIKIYPNPANEILNIEFVTLSGVEASNTNYSILNSLGQVIREEEIVFKNKTTSINTTELPNGVYTLKISNNRITINMKFIVSK